MLFASGTWKQSEAGNRIVFYPGRDAVALFEDDDHLHRMLWPDMRDEWIMPFSLQADDVCTDLAMTFARLSGLEAERVRNSRCHVFALTEAKSPLRLQEHHQIRIQPNRMHVIEERQILHVHEFSSRVGLREKTATPILKVALAGTPFKAVSSDLALSTITYNLERL